MYLARTFQYHNTQHKDLKEQKHIQLFLNFLHALTNPNSIIHMYSWIAILKHLLLDEWSSLVHVIAGDFS